MTPQVPSGSAGRNDRVPPHSEEAERGVLGSALLDAARVMDLCVQNQVGLDSFYVPAHQMVYEMLLGMTHEVLPIDLLTVTERLRNKGLLDRIGGAIFLEQLVDSTPTSAHASYYIDIVRQKALLRSIIEKSRDAIEKCHDPEQDAFHLLGQVEEDMFSITGQQRSAMAPWNTLVHKAIEEFETIAASKKGYTGIPTGFKDLDRVLLGFHKKDLIILAARPSMGKTALALNVAENVALGKGDHEAHPVAVFSLEMSAESLVRRMLCSHARVSMHRLQQGIMTKDSHFLLTSAASALMKAPLFIDDTAGLDVPELRSRARRMKRKYGVELIVIDYLQMLNYQQFSKEGRQRETAAISGSLKAMAKELDVPVLVLSQLSRAPETRDKTAVPKLSDLRDSGSIEQDADVVCLLRRPCKYKADEHADDQTLAIVDVAKHRNGPTDEVEMNFEEDYTRFSDRAFGVDNNLTPAGG